jgi:crotonobetainyl-CoA:carnitine CoA-transferase CaiB-like acyl-CoA transferase
MREPSPPSPPLAAIRVLDLSRILAGPLATQLLGDLGADVIKVERPGVGDDTRAWGPPYLRDSDGNETSESAYFLSCNRNKRSVTIDLARPEGTDLIRRLAGHADVLIENFKVGDLARRGLGYDDLKTACPRLIYCSISGFGQTGAYAPRAGYDFLVQGLGGVMSITGAADGPPMKVGVAVADVVCGLYAAVAVLAAIETRHRSGTGQHIDLSLLDTQVAWLVNQGLNFLVSGEAPGRLGNAHPNIVPYQVLPAADGYFILAVGNDAQFRRFAAFAGAPEWADDARFATNAERVRHRDVLVARIAERTQLKPAAAWIEGLEAAGVPCGPVNAIDQVFANPQVRHRGMAITMPHPLGAGGSVPLIGNPLKLSANPVTYHRPPPLLGQHTDEVLAELLGLSVEERAELRRLKVV